MLRSIHSMFNAATKTALYSGVLATAHRIHPNTGVTTLFVGGHRYIPSFSELPEETKIGAILAVGSIYYLTEAVHASGCCSKITALQISTVVMAAGFRGISKLCDYLAPDNAEEAVAVRPRF